MITKYNNGGEIAKTILKQLGGAGKLVAMTGAYNFVDTGKGLAFKIKNAKSNYIKITLTSLDLYDVEIGRIRGTTYKVVAEAQNLYADQLVPFIEKTTGMYLSLFARGGDVFNTLSSIMKSEDEEATDFILWENSFIDELKGVLKVDRGYAEEVAENNQMVIMDYYYKGFSPQDAAFLLMYGDNKKFASGGNVKFYNEQDSYRMGRPSGSIEKDILSRVSIDNNNFVGNFGWKTPTGLAEGYLYKLDDYDAMLIRPDMLKSGERVYRYVNRNTAIGGSMFLIKINYEKGLLYFTVPNDYDNIEFERKGVKALWINLISEKFAYGGELYDRYEEALDNFNPMNLDAYETMMYKNLTERGMDKVDALKIIINNVEGDYSQLSPSLAEIAQVEFVEERMAKGGMTTFQDKVDAISKRLEGTKVPKRLEKDYGKRYNKEEAIQAGRRIAGSIVAKRKYNDGGTIGDSPYTDAEIRKALQNFFAVPIKVVSNDNAYFAVKDVDFLKNDEYYFDDRDILYTKRNDEVWQYDYDDFEKESTDPHFNHHDPFRQHSNIIGRYQIEAYYPIKKGYVLEGVDELEDEDFKRKYKN